MFLRFFYGEDDRKGICFAKLTACHNFRNMKIRFIQRILVLTYHGTRKTYSQRGSGYAARHKNVIGLIQGRRR